MITDEERRRAATELREASTGAYRHVDALDVIAGSVGVDVAGKFSYVVENETYEALADFLDRPTCRDVGGSCEFVCSECGCSLDISNDYEPTMWVKGKAEVPSYCPNCGAEVVNGDHPRTAERLQPAARLL